MLRRENGHPEILTFGLLGYCEHDTEELRSVRGVSSDNEWRGKVFCVSNWLRDLSCESTNLLKWLASELKELSILQSFSPVDKNRAIDLISMTYADVGVEQKDHMPTSVSN